MRLLLRDPALATAGAGTLLCGAIIALLAPYQSLLAISTFGLSESGYAALLVAGSLVSVAAALGIGIATDRRLDRRTAALGCAGLAGTGLALMTLAPGPAAFVLAHGLLLPVGLSLFGQFFTLARLAAAERPAAERDGVMAAIRALFALPFLVVLPLWAAALRSGVDLLRLYPVTLGLGLLLLLLVLRRWPADRHAPWGDARSGLSLRQSLGEIGHPAVLGRIALVGAVSGGVALYMVLLPLVLEAAPGRGESDVALFAALVAGLEVPVMLTLPLVLRRVGKTVLIAFGAALYAGFLAAFSALAGGPAVWLLVLPAAIGGGMILSLPIAYLQDLMGPRAGAGGAILALQKVFGDGICAGVFALGTALSGHALAALLGGTAMLAGALALLLLDRRGAARPA